MQDKNVFIYSQWETANDELIEPGEENVIGDKRPDTEIKEMIALEDEYSQLDLFLKVFSSFHLFLSLSMLASYYTLKVLTTAKNASAHC